VVRFNREVLGSHPLVAGILGSHPLVAGIIGVEYLSRSPWPVFHDLFSGRERGAEVMREFASSYPNSSKADDALAQIKSGKAFEDVAKSVSDDPSKATGGIDASENRARSRWVSAGCAVELAGSSSIRPAARR